ncbi:hypothetical protein [Chitinophaga lutea]|nr:hypothetical protein [Chitinophaga lutea]
MQLQTSSNAYNRASTIPRSKNAFVSKITDCFPFFNTLKSNLLNS